MDKFSFFPNRRQQTYAFNTEIQRALNFEIRCLKSEILIIVKKYCVC